MEATRDAGCQNRCCSCNELKHYTVETFYKNISITIWAYSNLNIWWSSCFSFVVFVWIMLKPQRPLSHTFRFKHIKNICLHCSQFNIQHTIQRKHKYVVILQNSLTSLISPWPLRQTSAGGIKVCICSGSNFLLQISFYTPHCSKWVLKFYSPRLEWREETIWSLDSFCAHEQVERPHSCLSSSDWIPEAGSRAWKYCNLV